MFALALKPDCMEKICAVGSHAGLTCRLSPRPSRLIEAAQACLIRTGQQHPRQNQPIKRPV